jgi:selenocysteine-specific elongation factor
MGPGETGWAQVRLSEPVAAVKGDYFVLRTPNETVGGGQVVETHVRRHRRFHDETLSRLNALMSGEKDQEVLPVLSRFEPAEVRQLLPQLDLSLQELVETARTLKDSGRLIQVTAGELAPESVVMTRPGFDALSQRAAAIVSDYHRQFPLRPGIPREELRSRLGQGQRLFPSLAETWQAGGVLADADGHVRLPDFRPQPSDAQRDAIAAFLSSLESNPFSPPTDRLPDDEIIGFLVAGGEVVQIGDIVFRRSAYDEMVARTVSHLKATGALTLAQARDLFGTSRKYVQTFLEHLDEKRITRRVGDERVLRRTRGPAPQEETE